MDENTLKILTESAKYDVSCSSSGSDRGAHGKVGNTAFSGICHSFTADGRCVSLLKILLSNKCSYDCLYCVNRRSNDIPRASATPDEICSLVMNFYKRNYIEGLFLSSAIEKSPNHTMELLLETVRRLRKLYAFNGYIHLKGIPGADPVLLEQAGRLVDRMSFNIELPSERSLKLLAPQKSKVSIFTPMKQTALQYQTAKNERNNRFLPAGQTTQMIVGASPESDGIILRLTEGLYKKFSLKRVYYSSYIPANFKTSLLPTRPTSLLREHRLYQADWLLRFYGFSADEILDENENLDESVDPKCHWALKHMELFPLEVNVAPPELLARVPGIGFRSVEKIIRARRYTKLDFADLYKMRVVVKRAVHFITCNGKFFGKENPSTVKNLIALTDGGLGYEQLNMFSTPDVYRSIIGGQL